MMSRTSEGSRPLRRIRRDKPRQRSARIGLLAILLLPLAVSVPHAEGLAWLDEDWSGGKYSSAVGVDPEICPGHLVLNNDLRDLRFVANPTHYQGLYSMAAYHDTLFITASDYPYMFDGADVIAYDYLRDSFEVVYQPYESGLHMIKAFGDTLYIPGPDSQDPYNYPGSIYTYDGDLWREKASLPWAIHVNDVEVVGNVVYATTGQAFNEGCVWMSTDWCETFTRVLCIPPSSEQPIRRFFGLGHIGNRIFAQPDGYGPESNLVYSSTNGTNWVSIPVPHMPVDKHAMFTLWQGQLLMTIHNRLYIWNGVAWLENRLPFNGWRWCRGIHGYKGSLYGGGDTCRIFRWHGGSTWESVGSLPVDSTSTEIESMATYYGRLYISTSRPEQGVGMLPGLYVSAAAPSGDLVSLPHDFGTGTANARLDWSEYRPAQGHQAVFQVRSAPSMDDLLSRPFVGPDGTDLSYYETPGASLAPMHDGDRYFQYRVELRCPLRLRMPVLHSVELRADSLNSPSGAGDGPGNARAAVPGAGSRLEVGAFYPNPARRTASMTLSLRRPEAGATSSTALARVRVTDLEGRVLLFESVRLASGGSAEWRWDLRDMRGRPIPSGTYWVSVDLIGVGGRGTVRSIRVLR